VFWAFSDGPSGVGIQDLPWWMVAALRRLGPGLHAGQMAVGGPLLTARSIWPDQSGGNIGLPIMRWGGVISSYRAWGLVGFVSGGRALGKPRDGALARHHRLVGPRWPAGIGAALILATASKPKASENKAAVAKRRRMTSRPLEGASDVQGPRPILCRAARRGGQPGPFRGASFGIGFAGIGAPNRDQLLEYDAGFFFI